MCLAVLHVNALWFMICMYWDWCLCIFACTAQTTKLWTVLCLRPSYCIWQPADRATDTHLGLLPHWEGCSRPDRQGKQGANRMLTGSGLSHPTCTSTQAELQGTIRLIGRCTSAHLSARPDTYTGCKVTWMSQPGRQEIGIWNKFP